MKKYFFLAIILQLFFQFAVLAQFVELKNNQVHSEGKFYLTDNTLYCDAIVVKFKQKVFDLNKGVSKTTRHQINSKFTNIQTLLSDLAKNYGEMYIRPQKLDQRIRWII